MADEHVPGQEAALAAVDGQGSSDPPSARPAAVSPPDAPTSAESGGTVRAVHVRVHLSDGGKAGGAAGESSTFDLKVGASESVFGLKRRIEVLRLRSVASQCLALSEAPGAAMLDNETYETRVIAGAAALLVDVCPRDRRPLAGCPNDSILLSFLRASQLAGCWAIWRVVTATWMSFLPLITMRRDQRPLSASRRLAPGVSTRLPQVSPSPAAPARCRRSAGCRKIRCRRAMPR